MSIQWPLPLPHLDSVLYVPSMYLACVSLLAQTPRRFSKVFNRMDPPQISIAASVMSYGKKYLA